MAIQFSRTVNISGLDELLKNLAAYGENAKKAADAAVYEEAQAIEQASVTKYAPRDTSMLVEEMAFIDTVKHEGEIVSCTFGYRGPYAARLHENPRAGKTFGYYKAGLDPKTGEQRYRKVSHWAMVGQWKFLETPWNEAENGMLSRLADRMRTILGGRL